MTLRTVTPPSRLEQLALIVFFCAAVAAFGSSYQQPLIWIFWLPAALSMLWRVPAAPRPIVHALRNFSWTLLGLSVLLGLVLMAYAVLISESTAKVLTMLCGYGLGAFGALFLLGTPVWPAAEAALPAATGLLLVAAFNTSAKITPLLLAPGVAGFVYLLLTRRDARPLWRLISRRVVLSGAAATAIAWTSYTTLPRLQNQVEGSIIRFMMNETGSATPAATQSHLGDLEELKLSKRVTMRVWTSQPQKLRGRVFSRFDGQTWQAYLTGTTPLAQATSPLLAEVPGTTFAFGKSVPDAATPNLVSTRVVQTVISPGVLLSPVNKMLVRAPVANLSADAAGNLSPALTDSVTIYGIVNQPETVDAEGNAADFLAAPAKLDPRWRELAQKLAGESTSTDDRIARTVDYVKHAATYSLSVGKFETSDPVTEFFFVKRRGYCQYFATSAALLLRLQGIPARYVTGYVVQEYNSLAGHYVVRDADAHAWIEVFTPQSGWKEADPTPEAEFAARRESNDAGRIGQAIEYAAAFLGEMWIRVRQADWHGLASQLGVGVKVVAVVLLVWLIGCAAWFARRLRWRRRPRGVQLRAAETPARLQQYPALLNRCWETAGFPRPASRGLREHAERIPETSLELRRLSHRLVDGYYRGSFGSGDLPSDELRELDELVAQLAQASQRPPKS